MLAFQLCYVLTMKDECISASVLLCNVFLAILSEAIVGIHPTFILRIRASAMAHMEHEMRPPEYEPGAWGSYKITHSCMIDGVQVFHMLVWGVYQVHPHAFLTGTPWDASAVVYNDMGHAPEATGTYRIIEFDLRNRHCIIDLRYTIGRRMAMKWRIDKLATERVYKWEPWP